MIDPKDNEAVGDLVIRHQANKGNLESLQEKLNEYQVMLACLASDLSAPGNVTVNTEGGIITSQYQIVPPDTIREVAECVKEWWQARNALYTSSEQMQQIGLAS